MAVDLDRADTVAHTVTQTIKAMHGVRQHLPKPAAGVEHSAYPVLFVLARGRARVSGIAEAIGSDVSTISRQVGQLIEAGLAVRASDPDDGRAHLIELTSAGHDAITRSRELRAQYFSEVLRDWTPAEVDDFVTGLDRLRASIISTETPRTAAAKKESA